MLSEDQFHVEYGLLSNIPSCCVNFWIKVWVKITEKPDDIPYSQSVEEHLKLSKGWEYIPCPLCLKNKNKNKIKLDKDIIPEMKILYKKYNKKWDLETEQYIEYQKSL